MRLTLIALAITMLGISAGHAAECMVSDPSGTPLNIRNAPNGQVMGTLRNGNFVTLIGVQRDSRGRPWAEVLPDGYRQTVWVFREFISCR
jgi:hypothetical protein